MTTKQNNKHKLGKRPIKVSKKIDTLTNVKNIHNSYLGRAIAVIVGATYIVALYNVLRTNLVPTSYEVTILILSILVVVFVIFANLRNSWKSIIRSTLLVLVSILIVISNVYVSILCASTYDFLSSIQSGNFTNESYSIIAEKGVTSSSKIAYITEDSNKISVLAVAKQKTNAVPVAVNNLADVSTALDDHSIELAVVRTSLISLLQQNTPAFYNTIHVLYTFNISVKNMPTKAINLNKPFIVYISGIDTYGNVATVSRSDTNILAIVNPITHKILLVNTPRDYYVQLHGTTGIRDKLTHAGIYGIEMSKSTMQDLYGIHIDYYIRINFTSLLNIIDAIGGVSVYSDQDFKVGSYHFVKGYNQLNAKQALVFSRERHSFVDGDRQRGKDQQQVIQAIINKINQPFMLARYPKILDSIRGSIQTDANFNEITTFINHQANTLRSWQTDSISVTGYDSHNATYSMGSLQLYVMEPNIKSVNDAKSAIQSYLKP